MIFDLSSVLFPFIRLHVLHLAILLICSGGPRDGYICQESIRFLSRTLAAAGESSVVSWEPCKDLS